MREILFRGKRTDNGEWVEGYLVCYTFSGMASWVITDGNTTFEKGSMVLGSFDTVEPGSVGQYTDLTDANGTKIFEGDIVTHHAQGEIPVNTGSVIWDSRNGRWGLRLNTMCPDRSPFTSDSLEIIGNIFDNPELLGVWRSC